MRSNWAKICYYTSDGGKSIAFVDGLQTVCVPARIGDTALQEPSADQMLLYFSHVAVPGGSSQHVAYVHDTLPPKMHYNTLCGFTSSGNG